MTSRLRQGRLRPYIWQVIDAPEWWYIGRLFRWIDIQISAQHQDWPEGMVFQHLRNQRTIMYWQGRLQEVDSYPPHTSPPTAPF